MNHLWAYSIGIVAFFSILAFVLWVNRKDGMPVAAAELPQDFQAKKFELTIFLRLAGSLLILGLAIFTDTHWFFGVLGLIGFYVTAKCSSFCNMLRVDKISVSATGITMRDRTNQRIGNVAWDQIERAELYRSTGGLHEYFAEIRITPNQLHRETIQWPEFLRNRKKQLLIPYTYRYFNKLSATILKMVG